MAEEEEVMKMALCHLGVVISRRRRSPGIARSASPGRQRLPYRRPEALAWTSPLRPT